VQGVGFRPFVYRLARELGLCGWVRNDGTGVQIHVEGQRAVLAEFARRLQSSRPPAAVVAGVSSHAADVTHFDSFRILFSQHINDGPTVVRVPPERALCAACRVDIDDPADRRAGYPFTTCPECGPRYSILHRLPYDRPETSMAGFPLCAACRHEYEDPECRRFHAQPIACPACGPNLQLW